MNKVYSIVLNYKAWQETVVCVRSLIASGDEMSVVIVDNFSNNDSVENIIDYLENARSIPEVRSPVDLYDRGIQVRQLDQNETLGRNEVGILARSRNDGFSAGNNSGILLALNDKECSHIWLLNNDTVVAQNTLSKSLRHFQRKEDMGVLGSRLALYEEPEVLQGYGATFNKFSARSSILGFRNSLVEEQNTLVKVDSVIGASMLIERSYIENVGLLDEGYFLYREELDWALRGREKGYCSYSSMDTVIYHKQGVSTGNKHLGGKNLSSMKHMFRSHLRFYKKFYPWLLPIIYIVVIYRIVRLSRGQGSELLYLLKHVFFK